MHRTIQCTTHRTTDRCIIRSIIRTLIPSVGLMASCVAIQSNFPDPSYRTFSQKGEYIVGPGDVLIIMPSDTREATNQVIVSPSNTIQLPLIGEVITSGQTLALLSETISKKYAQYYKKTSFLVNVGEIRSYRGFVLGEVRNSGEYAIQSRATVLSMLAKAGGRTDFASGKITLIRRKHEGSSKYEFTYDALLNKESQAEPLYVERDDIIVVH